MCTTPSATNACEVDVVLDRGVGKSGDAISAMSSPSMDAFAIEVDG